MAGGEFDDVLGVDAAAAADDRGAEVDPPIGSVGVHDRGEFGPLIRDPRVGGVNVLA